ncbi:response regulator [Cohnella massiliensis]|uniref:response regulator n=1 Tax=Cohnella massiliensis TaxID=1816691 RepID=UPI0009BB6E36|nr:response regulator [Cohnella massiliensis]
MLTLLVVDDEIYALKGITQGIDWSDLPFASVLEAESVSEALEHARNGRVDLVISDIEMPEANGIELLRRLKELSPETLTIFLTGHARFEYAQEALHYGCFDYLLKPVDHDALKDIVRRAVREIERRKEQLAFEHMLDQYRRQWAQQLPILIERFWQEVLAGRFALSESRLEREFARYDIPLGKGGRVLPVLLSIEGWDAELGERDESIMEYAVRKAAEEIVLEGGPGVVLQDRDLNVALAYAGGGALDRKALLGRCAQYVAACRQYFHCRVSCYVGDAEAVAGLPAALERLTQLERANVAAPQSVIDANEAEAGAAAIGGGRRRPGRGRFLYKTPRPRDRPKNWQHAPLRERRRGGGVPPAPSFTEWGVLLDGGETEALALGIEQAMARYRSEGASREHLELFYYGFVHMLYQSASRKGVPVSDIATSQELGEGLAIRTPELMQGWAGKLIRKAGLVFQERQRDPSAVIAKIQAFIQEHLDRDLSRDDIAQSVYRNPAYLSRMFRKETGMSLTDYIVQMKMERAKRLLTETNDKISNIAEGLGYGHFSYFAKLFKKTCGVTPQEYRKKHQTVR